MSVPRPLPHSLEAEENLLSCCFADGADVVTRCISAGVRSSSFFDPRHAAVFGVVLSLHANQKPIEISVVAEELKASKRLADVGGYEFLTQISKPVTTASAGYFIETVSDLQAKRQLIRAAEELIEGANQPNTNSADLTARLQTVLEGIGDESSGIGAGITAADLCATPPVTPPELIAGVLYGGGTMMLSGPSKSRKTYTFLDLGVSVATGSDWLGFKTQQAAVIYLNFELSEHSFQHRLAAICRAKQVEPPANFRSFNLRGRTASMGMLAAELPRLIRTHGAGLVVLDPWYKIAAQSGAEENSNDGQARVLAEAERIVTANGAALVVGHHFAKGDASAKNSIDRAAGAGAMARWGDVIATLSEHEEPDAMVLEMHLRDFAPVDPIALRWQLPIWHRDDSLDPANLKKKPGCVDRHPASELLQKLTGPLTNKEWFAASGGWKDATFRRKRDELLNDGKVVCEMGTYRRA